MDTKKPQTPLVKRSESFEIYIPKEVESKIRHLCSVIHDVEWSGTLFYKYSGSLDNGDFKVTCVDLFVMDIGSSAYTEYKESADVISYRANNDLLEGIQEGLIHSHNNMATFFSNTDCNTLVEEGTNCNHFVSLIVNNAGIYTAAVTRRVVTESNIEATIKVVSSEYYDSYEGERIYLSRDKTDEETRTTDKSSFYIEYFNLNVVKEDADYLFQDIDSRLAELRKSKTVGTYYNRTGKYGTYSTKSPTKKESVYTGYPYPTLFDPDGDDYAAAYYAKGQHGTTTPKIKVKEESTKKTQEPAVFPLCLQESFDTELVYDLSMQLLTGDILATYDKKAVITDWVSNMDAYYEGRFGFLDSLAHPEVDEDIIVANNARLESWIEGIVEFIVYTRDEALLSRLNIMGEEEFDESDTAEVCAYSMYHYISLLPYSYVKGKMLETLASYIPDGVEDYQ